MKILAFIDLHGNKSALKDVIEKSKNADILICGGDLTNWGQNFKKLILMFEKTGKPLLIIHGNHETLRRVKDLSSQFKFVKNIHKKTCKIGKYTFFGYGGGGFSMKDPELEQTTKKLRLKSSKLIFITHGPPFGTKLDLINRQHVGCISVNKFITKFNPILHICGHLHENAGKKEVLNKTLIINPGPRGRILKV